jgi:hypothetical protein
MMRTVSNNIDGNGGPWGDTPMVNLAGHWVPGGEVRPRRIVTPSQYHLDKMQKA